MAVAYLGKVDAKLRYSRVASWSRNNTQGLQMSKSEAVLWLRYYFEIPEDAAPPVSSAWVRGALAYATMSELQSRVNRALAERCGQGMYFLTLLEHDGPFLNGVQVLTTPQPPSNASSNPSNSNVANAATSTRAWCRGLAAMAAYSILTLP